MNAITKNRLIKQRLASVFGAVLLIQSGVAANAQTPYSMPDPYQSSPARRSAPVLKENRLQEMGCSNVSIDFARGTLTYVCPYEAVDEFNNAAPDGSPACALKRIADTSTIFVCDKSGNNDQGQASGPRLTR